MKSKQIIKKVSLILLAIWAVSVAISIVFTFKDISGNEYINEMLPGNGHSIKRVTDEGFWYFFYQYVKLISIAVVQFIILLVIAVLVNYNAFTEDREIKRTDEIDIAKSLTEKIQSSIKNISFINESIEKNGKISDYEKLIKEVNSANSSVEDYLAKCRKKL